MMKQVMKRAWELAKQGVVKFGGKVREYFAASLSIAWKEIKQMSEKTIELVGSEKQIKWANDIRERILTFAELLKPQFEILMETQIAKQTDADKIATLEVAKQTGLNYIADIATSVEATYYINKFRTVKEVQDAVKAFQNTGLDKITDKALSLTAGAVWKGLV